MPPLLYPKKISPSPTVAFFATVQQVGERQVERNIAYYNLDMIISVGYRVKSYRGVQFRICSYTGAEGILDKGICTNDELLPLDITPED